MVLGAFLTEIIVAFLLAGTLLFKYGNVFRHHIIVTISVLIAWYFSLLIIFILPLDVSSVIILLSIILYKLIQFNTRVFLSH